MLVALIVVGLIFSMITLAGADDTAASAVNLALNKPITESSHTQYFFVKNANDGNINSYWEGAAGSYPDLLTVDFEAATKITSVVIKLNPKPIWEERTQTIEVLGSMDGATFTTFVAPVKYTFDPDTNQNIVTISVAANARYLRLSFTTNSEADAGQVAELEVY